MSRLALLALILLVTPGCSLQLGGDDAESGRRALVDERRGAYKGVPLGTSVEDLLHRFGDPVETGGGFHTAGELFTGPISVANPGRIPKPPMALQYDDVVFLTLGRFGVYALTSTAGGAVTRAGVRVGDPLARVRESYDRVRCGESIQGEPIWSDEPSTYSWCMTRVGDIGLHFGGDPIQSITIGRAELIKSR